MTDQGGSTGARAPSLAAILRSVLDEDALPPGAEVELAYLLEARGVRVEAGSREPALVHAENCPCGELEPDLEKAHKWRMVDGLRSLDPPLADYTMTPEEAKARTAVLEDWRRRSLDSLPPSEEWLEKYVPERERWLWRNRDAFMSLQMGIVEAGQDFGERPTPEPSAGSPPEET